MGSKNSFDTYINSILPGVQSYDFADKARCRNQFIRYMLNRTQCMFRWAGLPETIPARNLELYLQTNGNACFADVGGDLYVFTGGMGGVPDIYYMPTVYTIANPALPAGRESMDLKIGTECIVMPNDSLYMGLLPMFSRYASQMTETELSLKIANINSRIVNLISAGDDRTHAAAEEYLHKIEDGKQGVIAENAFLDGVRSQPYGNAGSNGVITNLIELMQYQKASWYNDIGLNANYNMKRESLNSSESQMNNDALLPLVDDMLMQRQNACKEINKMFGTTISVSLASSWEDNAQEIELEHESLGGDENAGAENDIESVPELGGA